MTNWKAVTESGTTYTFEDGRIGVTPKGIEPGTYFSEYFTVYDMKVAEDRRDINYPWKDDPQYPRWVDVTIPVVGKLLYVAGKDAWRISTPIASIEMIGEQE